MEVPRSWWYAAVLVLPSEGFDVEDMTAYEGVVVMALDTEDEAAHSSMISVV
jgi:hypothetical protein